MRYPRFARSPFRGMMAVLFLVVASPMASVAGESSGYIAWQTDYAKAMDLAERHQKMLFVLFYESDDDTLAQYFQWKVLDCRRVRQILKDYVCVKLRCDTSIRASGQDIRLIDHVAFSGLNGQPGFAILDFAHKGVDYYGCVVSTFPFAARRCYSARQVVAALELPPGRPSLRRALYLAKTRLFPGRGRSAMPAVPSLQPDADMAVAQVRWWTNYAEAMTAAETERKMLLVYFCDCDSGERCARFKSETLNDLRVRYRLQDYVCVQVPMDAKITSGGKEMTLLEHGAFREMLGRPGIAIVDFTHVDSTFFGQVVSTFPITEHLSYTPERMAVILDLPPGTLTQRTLIYAVRIHPEQPASTDSEISPYLLRETESHSQYQADLRLQGHHHWETRFHRIVGNLPGGLTAKEVCAESWPGQNLVDSAIECVRCWRLSSGHWDAVRSPNHYFGYDMKRGPNGVWYATGIFGT